MEKETEERFIALETKIAYMDDFISKLQEEAVENQILAGRIQDLSENLEIPNRKPPHY